VIHERKSSVDAVNVEVVILTPTHPEQPTPSLATHLPSLMHRVVAALLRRIAVGRPSASHDFIPVNRIWASASLARQGCDRFLRGAEAALVGTVGGREIIGMRRFAG
jgi:hypothetical protein